MKQIFFYCDKKQIFNAVIRAAKNLDLEVNKKSMTDGYLELEHTGNLLSFGNKIDVKIKSPDNIKHIIKVSSRSSAVFQIIDWGTNDKLESDILDEIKNILGR
jgi:hypothetical protein